MFFCELKSFSFTTSVFDFKYVGGVIALVSFLTIIIIIPFKFHFIFLWLVHILPIVTGLTFTLRSKTFLVLWQKNGFTVSVQSSKKSRQVKGVKIWWCNKSPDGPYLILSSASITTARVLCILYSLHLSCIVVSSVYHTPHALCLNPLSTSFSCLSSRLLHRPVKNYARQSLCKSLISWCIL